MDKWTEITVDEDLLIPVVRELLDMAVDPSHVEVVHGTSGRTILVDPRLAEHWYQERLAKEVVIETILAPTSADSGAKAAAVEVTPVSTPAGAGEVVVNETTFTPAPVDDARVFAIETISPAPLEPVRSESAKASLGALQVVATETIPVASSNVTEDSAPLPVRRGPGRPRKTVPSASLDGEDS